MERGRSEGGGIGRARVGGWVGGGGGGGVFFFFKQKTAYEILTCDWSSDVCSSDLIKLSPAVRLDIPPCTNLFMIAPLHNFYVPFCLDDFG